MFIFLRLENGCHLTPLICSSWTRPQRCAQNWKQKRIKASFFRVRAVTHTGNKVAQTETLILVNQKVTTWVFFVSLKFDSELKTYLFLLIQWIYSIISIFLSYQHSRWNRLQQCAKWSWASYWWVNISKFDSLKDTLWIFESLSFCFIWECSKVIFKT